MAKKQDTVNEKKIIKEYLSLCRRQNEYIYIVNGICYYTTMEENDIIHYDTTIKHRPIHKVSFKDPEFMNALYSVFPAFEKNNICLMSKRLATVINKYADIRDIKISIENNLFYIKDVRTVNTKQGFKVLTPKEHPKDVVIRDIEIGRAISEHIQFSIDNQIEAQDGRHIVAKKIDSAAFKKSETSFLHFKDGEIETLDKETSISIKIPLWDGETTISVTEYLKKQKFKDEPQIIAELIVANKTIQLRMKVLTDKFNVVSLHHRRWFPFK